MKILVTGAAGFIGHNVSMRLLDRGEEVIGLDNLNDYYDVTLKQDRLAQLNSQAGFTFVRINLQDRAPLEEVFRDHKPHRVINLAAQAGVRYSLTNPHTYAESNLTGFLNILECCRHHEVEHLLFASSSSVYGANTHMPYNVEDNVDHPLSLYAATKKSNELMAHSYAHLYKIPVTGLRFFTVYGPWGRPDMSPFIFTKKIMEGQPIDVFNFGKHKRDFTYIDDITDGVIATVNRPAPANLDWGSNQPDPASSKAPYRLYNLGNNKPVELMYFISCIERSLGKKAEKNFLPLQPGDVPETYANISSLQQEIGFNPTTSIEDGIDKFVEWYRTYYQ